MPHTLLERVADSLVAQNVGMVIISMDEPWKSMTPFLTRRTPSKKLRRHQGPRQEKE